MHPERWVRVGDLFSHAIELPPAERAAWVERACSDDAVLREELLRLLAAHGDGNQIAPEGLLPSAKAMASVAVAGPGDRVGPYRLEAVIGRGGMGEVYRAARVDDQFEQQVAIKMVRPERSSPELVRRFLQERQIMANLRHPNIVPLLDGGITEGGQPYLVLPYIDGLPITRYVMERKLDLRKRLQLFVTVCNAVQFAHRHLVVHRDLKPSNILVDGDGEPQLLDFGIAKLLDPAAESAMTGDLLLLTPEHAAPEQFTGAPVTTATDVYALGILLYEMITGARPFRALQPSELARAVVEQAPARPGSILPVDADLEQVVLMALRKEPARRYAFAGDLAADVTRFLGGWPVVARPDTAGYRFRRFVARNRVWVAAAGLVAATLVVATTLVVRESGRRAAALREAESQQVRSARITDFLLGVFRATNPNETRGRSVTARELLDQASARIRRDLANEPAARGDLELAIGRAYSLVGLNRTADTILTRLVAELRSRRPIDSLALANALEVHGRIGATLGRLREGIQIMREVIAIRERSLGPDAPEMASAYHRIGAMAEQLDPLDRDSVAAKSLVRALALYRKADTLDTRAIVDVLRFQATLVDDAGRSDEALAIMKEAVATAERTTDAADPFRFNVYETYAIYLQANGLSDSAIAIHRRLLADRRRVFGPEHPDVSFSLFNLARDLGHVNRFEESLALFRECLALREKLFGPDHLQTGFALGAMADATANSGDLAGGLALFERAARVTEGAVGADNVDAMEYRESAGFLQARLGRREAALGTLARLVSNGYRDLGRVEWGTIAGDERFRALAERVARDSLEGR